MEEGVKPAKKRPTGFFAGQNIVTIIAVQLFIIRDEEMNDHFSLDQIREQLSEATAFIPTFTGQSWGW